MQSSTATAPTRRDAVLTDLELRDVELALLGVLPSGHVAGTGVSGSSAEPAEGLLGLRRTAEQVPDDIDELSLVDQESTPIAVLERLSRSGDLLLGTVRRARHRESGETVLPPLGESDLDATPSGLMVLTRPLLADEALPDLGRTPLLMVPDHEVGTGGVPPRLIAASLRRVAPAEATLRSAPVARHGPAEDLRLVELLGRRAGCPAVLVGGSATTNDRAWEGILHQVQQGGSAPVQGLHPEDVQAILRWRRPRDQRGLVLMFTGLSGSGKSTIARALSDRLAESGLRTVTLLDGDVVRQLLSSGLGFDRESRLLNLRRIGWVAAEVARHGGVAICAPIAPYAGIRAEMRAMAERTGDFVLVHVSTPLQECERRDLKGLYAKARRGEIAEFTGISDPYEEPEDAALRIDTTTVSVQDAVDQVTAYLTAGGWLSSPTATA